MSVPVRGKKKVKGSMQNRRRGRRYAAAARGVWRTVCRLEALRSSRLGNLRYVTGFAPQCTLELLTGHQVTLFQIQRQGFQWQWLVVGQKSFANVEEFSSGGGAADLMQELAGGFDADPEIVHVLFHLLHLGGFVDVGRADSVVKR